ncbi:hypothetical protein H311_03835 [Anncaliia algerae PRA109]|nr:hypothetical protein H311_04766 [Anncaliia algerae PRA109]KCZ74293.1 hypothetical protein H311_04743 [Anncaliia algerae PRA109]KCZ75192.1 hypothetical protein H311_03835 [Anncaliia algerae PRA109]
MLLRDNNKKESPLIGTVKRTRKRIFLQHCCETGCRLTMPFKLNTKLMEKIEKIEIIRNPLFNYISRRICKDKKNMNFYCSSCKVSVTMYWRDGWEENILLCNKCGLRFEKIRFYCKKCLYVPNKKEHKNKDCVNCLFEW